MTEYEPMCSIIPETNNTGRFCFLIKDEWRWHLNRSLPIGPWDFTQVIIKNSFQPIAAQPHASRRVIHRERTTPVHHFCLAGAALGGRPRIPWEEWGWARKDSFRWRLPESLEWPCRPAWSCPGSRLAWPLISCRFPDHLPHAAALSPEDPPEFQPGSSPGPLSTCFPGCLSPTCANGKSHRLEQYAEWRC